MFENCAPFRNCITEQNNMQIKNAGDLDAFSVYYLIKYSDNYTRISGSLFQITAMNQL